MNDGSGLQNQPGVFGTKFPAYWGIGMWTGLAGTFRRADGQVVRTASTVADLGAFASSNGRLVLVNKSLTDRTITIGLGG